MSNPNGSEEQTSKGGALSKLTFVSYKDEKFSTKLDEYSVMVNPTDYSSKMGINYAMSSDNAKCTPTYKGYQDNVLNFKFVLDNSGAIESNSVPLTKRISDLEKTVYSYQGDTHEAPFLKINWGTLSFGGRMKDMTVVYKMFDNDGEPIRAEVDISILRFTDIETIEKQKNKSSPDLSHLFTIKSGDSLPKLCLNVYGSVDYVDEVARINGLSGFRRLEPGMKLLLPPLSDKKDLN